jgi:multidrug efflux pump subunit AcrA (membrane-fusion protein)
MGLENKKLGQQGEQFLANLQLEKDNLAAQREQFAQKLGLDVQQLDLSRAQLSQQDRQFLAELDQKGQQLAQQESQFTRDQANKVTLANIDAANREKLMQLEAGYKQDIASNDNISRAWGTMMESIDRIQTNGDLDPSTKQTLVSNTQASFQSFANFWKKVGGGNVDVSDLLTFGPQNGSPVTPGGNSQGSTQMPNVYQPDYSGTQWGG